MSTAIRLFLRSVVETGGLPIQVPRPNAKGLDDGQLEANLVRCYTEAGRGYFATVERQAERAGLIGFIKARKVNPNR